MDAKVYAVSEGHRPGYYRTWPEVQEHIKGYSDPKFRKFKSLQAAEDWYNHPFQCASRARRRRQKTSDESVHRQMQFLNSEIALNPPRRAKISKQNLDAVIEGLAALEIGKAMIVTKSDTGFDFQPSTSPSSYSSPFSSPCYSTLESPPQTTPSLFRFQSISSPAPATSCCPAITYGYGSQDDPIVLDDEEDIEKAYELGYLEFEEAAGKDSLQDDGGLTGIIVGNARLLQESNILLQMDRLVTSAEGKTPNPPLQSLLERI
ncbi:ribonuclease HI [Fusarium austroafricanum]|uniref:Ribonuclease HI n=1 Tax=Fusarium austroafricanum TaxID=2364996 RepID=A0A8H4K6L4_9HYPO|nr:ribonuclease HI [Fusarium austroafricanum]